MKRTDERAGIGAVAFMVVAAIVGAVFIGLTVAEKVSRAEPWWPWLLLPICAGLVTGGVLLLTQRAPEAETTRTTTLRWALVAGLAGLALLSLAVFLVSGIV